MNFGVAKVGMEVVVNDADDAVIYTISRVADWVVDLDYFSNGERLNGGLIDISFIKLPNKKQLANRQK